MAGFYWYMAYLPLVWTMAPQHCGHMTAPLITLAFLIVLFVALVLAVRSEVRQDRPRHIPTSQRSEPVTAHDRWSMLH